MPTANQNQVGGTHYKTNYEHWDLVVFTDMGYLEGNITKYMTRWRKKDGVKDLLKALHYLNKLIEVYAIYGSARMQSHERVMEEVAKFTIANELNAREQEFIEILCVYEALEELYEARSLLGAMMEQANDRPGTPEDGGHHQPRRRRSHYPALEQHAR